MAGNYCSELDISSPGPTLYYKTIVCRGRGEEGISCQAGTFIGNAVICAMGEENNYTFRIIANLLTSFIVLFLYLTRFLTP